MALCAIRSHLSLVNISVAFLAVLADVGEYRVDVASRAFHPLVHSSQRIFGIAMVELENAPNRMPALGCVTVFAGNAQCSVGTA